MIARMEKERTWQLCRTGVFGADGARITERDLEEIRETFSPPRPVTVGHDGSDRFPKFGDVTDIVGIYPDGRHPGEKVLVGKVVLRPELARVFSDGGAGGLYSGWSVTIPRRASDGKRYLHSLAVCGAVPPKIPELEALMVDGAFGDGDTVETAGFDGPPEYTDGGGKVPEEEKKKLEDLETENARLRKKLEELEEAAKKKDGYSDDVRAVREELAEAQKELRAGRLDRFSDTALAGVPEGLKAKALAAAQALADADAVEFDDGSGAVQKGRPLDLLRDVLAAWPAEKLEPVYSFSDGDDGKKKKGNDWAEIASKL